MIICGIFYNVGVYTVYTAGVYTVYRYNIMWDPRLYCGLCASQLRVTLPLQNYQSFNSSAYGVKLGSQYIAPSHRAGLARRENP